MRRFAREISRCLDRYRCGRCRARLPASSGSPTAASGPITARTHPTGASPSYLRLTTVIGEREEPMRAPRFVEVGVGFAAAAMIAVVATAPSGTRAADHLDAPNLAAREDADINDVYVFQASDPSRTVIAVTTSPAAGVIGPIDYATNVRYKISVDRDGDAVPDLAYVFDFDAPSGGTQSYTVTRYKGENARTLEHGKVLGTGMRGEATPLKEHSLAFAGLRADPFFFDLNAFKHVVLGANNGRTGFCDQAGGAGIDFFAPLNTNAMVLEVRDRKLGKHIGEWATTVGPQSGDHETGHLSS